jgi:hypothetical protein
MLTAVALIAAPAFAEVQNVKVSGDIDSKLIYRNNYDFLEESTAVSGSSLYNRKDNDSWFMTTTRVRIDADLTDNVSTVVRIINERDWDQEEAATTDMDLDLAYIVLKECFYSPLTMTIGRQNLRFGNGLVVGDPYTNDAESLNRIAADDLSNIKAFDAIRATLDYSPTVVDVIYAKIDANDIARQTDGLDNSPGPRDDVDLWGVNLAYDFNNSYNAVAEAYLFSRRDRSPLSTSPVNTETCNVWGANASMEPVADLLLSAEFAYQNGDYVDSDSSPDRTIDRDAWAYDIGLVYDGFSDKIEILPALSLKLAYIFRSGQSNDGTSTDDDVDATTGSPSEINMWDPMYEDQTYGIVANRIFDGINDGVQSNGRTIQIGATTEPLEDLTLSVDYYFFELDEKWYSTGAATQNRTLGGISYGVTDQQELGTELDVALDYAYTEDVNMSLVAGWFFPGDVFDNKSVDNAGISNNNDTASEVIASVAVAF